MNTAATGAGTNRPSAKQSARSQASQTREQTDLILQSDGFEEADVVLQELLGLVIREHVSSWYLGISREPDFLNRVKAIFAHVIRQLESRVAAADLVELVAIDLPQLLERHIRDWHDAVDKAGTAHAHNADAATVFHHMQPHVALSLVDENDIDASHPHALCTVDKSYLRAVVDSLLKLLLPVQDYEAETERLIVREIVVNVVLGAIFDKTSQPWMLREILLRQLLELRASRAKAVSVDAAAESNLLSSIHKLSSVARETYGAASALFAFATSSPSFAKQPDQNLLENVFDLCRAALPPSKAIDTALHYVQLPTLLSKRLTNSLVCHLLARHVLTADRLRDALTSAKHALFPDGRPPPKKEDPDQDEQERVKADCEAAVAELIPARLVKMVKGQGLECEDQQQVAQFLLEPFSTRTANVHLFLVAFDLIIGKLFPELVLDG